MAKKSLKSPKGIAAYPHLNKADFKFNEDGVWKTDLIVPKDDETEAFIDAVKAVAAEAYGEGASEAHMPFFQHKEDETKMVLRFSTKWEPALHSASGAKVSRKGLPMIGSGTTLRINTSAERWPDKAKGTGVKLYLDSAQIIDLVEYGAGDFDNEEGGWEPEMAGGGDFADETDNTSADTPAPKQKNYGF